MKKLILLSFLISGSMAMASESPSQLTLNDFVCVLKVYDKVTDEESCNAAKFEANPNPALGMIAAHTFAQTKNFEVTGVSTTNGVTNNTLTFNQELYVTSGDKNDSLLLRNLNGSSAGMMDSNNLRVQFMCLEEKEAAAAGLCLAQ